MKIETTENIVREGIVLYLDAGQKNSYPGSGTTWTDLSGNGNTGTLVNGVGYSASNGGALTFDGFNDYMRIPIFTNTPQSTMTLLYWINFTQKGCIAQQSRNYNDSLSEWMFQFDISGKLLFWDFGTIDWGFNFETSNTTLSTNIWYQVGFVKNGTSGIFYLNGVQDGTVTAASNVAYGSNDYVMGFDYRDNNTYFGGKIAQALIYNRALTATEIMQNFQTLRGRFFGQSNMSFRGNNLSLLNI